MIFADSFPKPRVHLNAAAKAMVLAAIRTGHMPRSPAAAAAAAKAAAGSSDRPLVNRFGRPFLPIDKHVPLPDGMAPKTARPFALLAIGESFFEPCNGVSIETLTTRVKWDAKAYSPAKFETAAVMENDVEGLRVWRVV